MVNGSRGTLRQQRGEARQQLETPTQRQPEPISEERRQQLIKQTLEQQQEKDVAKFQELIDKKQAQVEKFKEISILPPKITLLTTSP